MFFVGGGTSTDEPEKTFLGSTDEDQSSAKKANIMYKLAEVIALTTLSKSTIYRMIDTGKFPPSHLISSRRVGWKKDEVDGFIASR